MIRHSVRIFWALLGCSALALGVLGIVLPLLPTTPFILLAAYSFARSSKPVYDWLLRHRIFGPLIENWRRYGAISRRAKILGLASLIAVFAISLQLGAPPHAVLIQAVILPLCGLFVMSRPRPPGRHN
ncbi:YbaN family protein [Hyphobacterium indicum]|uniref:YbaN family protein n=1 Tax=Hyphobacterium indicum TaxID=2162714 RepID=UPI001F327A79|nr:YbaN family protein [Hyphobacterium indicum]